MNSATSSIVRVARPRGALTLLAGSSAWSSAIVSPVAAATGRLAAYVSSGADVSRDRLAARQGVGVQDRERPRARLERGIVDHAHFDAGALAQAGGEPRVHAAKGHDVHALVIDDGRLCPGDRRAGSRAGYEESLALLRRRRKNRGPVELGARAREQLAALHDPARVERRARRSNA